MLDPFSTLISAGVVIGPDTVIYPGVVIQKDAASRLELGARNVLYRARSCWPSRAAVW